MVLSGSVAMSDVAHRAFHMDLEGKLRDRLPKSVLLWHNEPTDVPNEWWTRRGQG